MADNNKEELFQTWRNRISLDVKMESRHRDYSAVGVDEDGEPINPDRVPFESYRNGINKKGFKDYNPINVVQPLRLFRPSTLKDIEKIVDKAAKGGLKVKAVGSGHSYSDMTTTPDFLVMTDQLNGVLRKGEVLADKSSDNQVSLANLEQNRKYLPRHFPFLKKNIQEYLQNRSTYHEQIDDLELTESEKENLKFPLGKDPVDDEPMHLFEIEAGIKIRKLNKVLDIERFALLNMGTYQGQAFMGAVSTSTHGSGILLGALPNMILSMVIVTTTEEKKAVVYRIEPSNGITRTSVANKSGSTKTTIDEFGTSVILLQDDDIFNAALVNMGCFGIVYSVIIAVRPTLYLVEQIEWMEWKMLKELLNKGYTFPNTSPSQTVESDINTETNNLKYNMPEETFDFFRRKNRFRLGYRKEDGANDELFDVSIKEHNPYTAIRNLEIYINPYTVKEGGKDTHFCKIIRRYKADPKEVSFINSRSDRYGKTRAPSGVILFFGKIGANIKAEIIGNNVSGTITELEQKTKRTPEWINRNLIFRAKDPNNFSFAGPKETERHTESKSLYKFLLAQTIAQKRYVHQALYGNVIYNLYPQGGDRIGGYGAELGLDFESNAYIEGVDKLLEVARRSQEEGKHVQLGIISVRFVAASPAFLSPQRKNTTVMLELPSLNDTHGGKELMYRYQRALLEMGARPHWGLEFNVLNGCNDLLKHLYPQLDKWKSAYNLFNSIGVFDNRFTDRMGFSVLYKPKPL